MIDCPIRLAGLIVSDQSDAILARNVLRCDNDKFAPLEVRSTRNVFDYTARDLPATRRAVEHPRHGHVVDVARRASHFVAGFLARHRLADDVLFRHGFSQNAVQPRSLVERRASPPGWTGETPVIPSYESSPRITVLASNLPPCGSSAKLAVGKHALSPQIRRLHNTPQPFPQIRRYGMPIIQPIFGHDELRFWFEDREVGINPCPNPAFARGAPSQSSRLFAHPPR